MGLRCEICDTTLLVKVRKDLHQELCNECYDIVIETINSFETEADDDENPPSWVDGLGVLEE